MNIKAVISIDSGGNIKEYPSMKVAAEVIGVKPSQIAVACNTTRKCHGLEWWKKEDYDKEWHEKISTRWRYIKNE